MPILLVVNNPKNWPLEIPGVDVVQARRYITDPVFTHVPGARVFNLCTSYRYQTTGYYVSLLAAARGHRPIPDVGTLRDLNSRSLVRLVSEDLEQLIQKSLAPIQSDRFSMSVYFGHNTAKRYDQLSMKLFGIFRAPLLRAEFVKAAAWQLQRIGPIGVSEVPDSHREFLVQVATDYFSGRGRRVRPKKAPRYNLAILCGNEDPHPPSNPRAIKQFCRAAERCDIAVDVIGKDDISRLPEYDALFIRETTYVTNHTFRFARRAEAEGLVVIDDPLSILKCTNKVFLAEVLNRHRVATPKTVVVHRDNLDVVQFELGLPCILKQPDSSYSQGVVKVNDQAELRAMGRKLLEKSDLIIAQKFLPTPFDWRIGIVDGKPLYACKYWMANRHWQIVKRGASGQVRDEGHVDTLPIEEAPAQVVQTALRAARTIGNGLYGVDLKEVGSRCYVIEVNDNPSIDAGFEDAVLKEALYDTVMQVFVRRMDALRQRSDDEA